MYESMSYMSIWELAHRWENADPMTPAGASIPLSVQPTIRALSSAVASGHLAPFRPVVYRHASATNDEIGTGVEFLNSTPLDELEAQILISGELNREILSSLYIHLESAFFWAAGHGFEVPDFIVPKDAWDTNSDAATPFDLKEFSRQRRPRGEIETKAMCQGVAITLWDMNPEMRIAHVSEHELFLKVGGSNYSENTRRAWAREVAPESIKSKPGRPSKISK